jgi:hypothetical protein
MAQQTLTAVASAIAPSTVVSISGFDSIDSARETLFDLGGTTYKAEKLREEGELLLGKCDANLYDIVTMPGEEPGKRVSIPYVEFMLVREFHVAGAVDKLDSVTAAEKRWERQISRIMNGLGFVRPKSESKDAVRKAEAKAAEIAKLAEFGDSELDDIKSALLAKGDAKSLREALKLNMEIDRRNATGLDAAKAQRKAISDKLIARVKELTKAGTDDADALLISALQMLG